MNDELTIDDLIAIINKKFGKGALVRASEIKTEIVSCGIPILDYVLGGGIPRGRLIQLYGTFNSGKTTISLRTIVAAQKRGEKCAFIDTEKTYDAAWAQKIGVDNESLYIVRPKYGEEAIDIMETLVSSKLFSIVVLDSIASLAPILELEKKMEQQQMGVFARMMNKAVRKLIAVNENTILFMINQMREKIGVLFGSPYTRPGGRGLDFNSTIIIRIRRGDWLEFKEKKIGHYIVCNIEKNKVAPPRQVGQFPFYYDGSIDNSVQYVEIALMENLIERKGAWYYFGGEKYQGIDKIKKVILKDKDFIKKVDEKVKEGIKYIRKV